MRVIEQLIVHFWTRGALSQDEVVYLIEHGFVRERDLPGYNQGRAVDPETYVPSANTHPDELADEHRKQQDEAARRAEQLEDELTGRNAGTKKGGGKKKKPSGHNFGPAIMQLTAHFANRKVFPALVELGCRLKPCTTWQQAATAIGDAQPAELETALVALLNTRPRALGELWFWFEIESLFDWADQKVNEGPVAEGLGKLMRATNRNEVGRLGQLMKSPEFRDLGELLEARRNVLALLPALYDKHFARLRNWLVPPVGVAANCWPALPWAFVLVYNVRHPDAATLPPGYDVNWHELDHRLRELAFTTALAIEREKVLGLLTMRARELTDRATNSNYLRVQLFHCPLDWRI